MQYYQIELPHSSRTGWQIENWSIDKIEHNIEIVRNKNGTYSVVIPEDFEAPGPKIAAQFRDYKIPPKGTYIGEGELYKSAKITDVISGSNINESNRSSGYVMNERTLAVLSGFKIGNFQSYEFPIKHKGKVYEDYSFLAFDGNASPFIDFEKSTFELKNITDLISNPEVLDINTEEEFHRAWKDEKLRKSEHLFLQFREIQFTPNFDLDMFTFHKLPFTGIYASEKLAEKFKAEKISGIEFQKKEMFQKD